MDDEKTVDYNTHCHPHCYLRDVERECIGHSGLRYCSAMNQNARLCEKCECRWRKHMHITYEYQLSTVYIEINSSNISSSLATIDIISDLRDEQSQIIGICNELSKFIKQNSLTPYNDDILAYIRYFIREEEMKKAVGANNEKIIEGLQKLIEECF